MERIKKIDKEINNLENKIQEEESLAMMMFKNQLKDKKRWFIAFLTVTILWFATICGFLYYIIHYGYEEIEEYTQESNYNENTEVNQNIGK